MADKADKHLPHCYRCKRPIGEQKPKSDEPCLCGPCRHDVYRAAGTRAVQEYYEIMRAGVSDV